MPKKEKHGRLYRRTENQDIVSNMSAAAGLSADVEARVALATAEFLEDRFFIESGGAFFEVDINLVCALEQDYSFSSTTGILEELGFLPIKFFVDEKNQVIELDLE